MYETTTEQQMKNKKRSDGEHSEIETNSDKTNTAIRRTAMRRTSKLPLQTNRSTPINAEINKDLRQSDDQAHKHNIQKPTYDSHTTHRPTINNKR
jgi:hypothetical protein